MGKLTYAMSVSLGGYISGPGGEFDWSAPDEELHRFHNERIRRLGAHLLGRRLYEVMLPWEKNDELGHRLREGVRSDLAAASQSGVLDDPRIGMSE